jgi:hypothetical protein
VLRTAFELVTGETLGYDWDLGFKNMGLAGWVVGDDGTLGGSRIFHIASKFAPMTVLSIAQKPDAGVAAIMGPTRKGTGYQAGIDAAVGILGAYADRGAYDKIHSNPRVKSNLEALTAGILDAVGRNGYDPDVVLNTARGIVFRDLYAEFYKGFNARDTEAMEVAARKIMRVNGTVDSASRSLQQRERNAGRPELSAEQKAVIAAAFETP